MQRAQSETQLRPLSLRFSQHPAVTKPPSSRCYVHSFLVAAVSQVSTHLTDSVSLGSTEVGVLVSVS